MAKALAPLLRRWMARDTPAARVMIERALGSTPREAGATMLVTAEDVCGTIGGGRLELDAVDSARAMLAGGELAWRWDVPLGPTIGQCCGGRVWLLAERADARLLEEIAASDRTELPLILLFGAGHVGRALSRALAPLPFRVRWIDERAEEFDITLADDVDIVVSSDWDREIRNAPPGSACIVLTHSHALDSLITAAALERGDFAYVGLIGSRTKRRRFERAFRDIGIPEEQIGALVCPIGNRGVRDKRPEIIAALTAAEIIEVFADRVARARPLYEDATEETVHEHRPGGRIRQSA